MARPRVSGATVREVAASTGVSIATVSRVLNGHPHVAEATRERVQGAMQQLGLPTPRRRPASRRSQRLGVYVRCPYVLTDYFGLIVSSIAETLELHGRHVILDAGEAAQQMTVLPTLARQIGRASCRERV